MVDRLCLKIARRVDKKFAVEAEAEQAVSAIDAVDEVCKVDNVDKVDSFDKIDMCVVIVLTKLATTAAAWDIGVEFRISRLETVLCVV